MGRARLDLNNPEFQRQLFQLPKPDIQRLIGTLRRLRMVTWEQIYADSGLRWEAILSRHGPDGEALYTIRVSQKCRAVVMREGDWMRFLTIHPDHDGAYR